MLGILELMKKLDKLKIKKFRHAYLAEHIRVGIATQIRILRSKAKMTQLQLAQMVGTKQGVISRLEDPDSGYANLNTLLKIAEALDVSLMVKFVSFGKFIEESRDVSQKGLAVSSYTEELDNLNAQKYLINRAMQTISDYSIRENVFSVVASQVFASKQVESYVSDVRKTSVSGKIPELELYGKYAHLFQRKEINTTPSCVILNS